MWLSWWARYANQNDPVAYTFKCCTYPIKMLLLFCSVAVLGRRPPPTKRVTNNKNKAFEFVLPKYGINYERMSHFMTLFLPFYSFLSWLSVHMHINTHLHTCDKRNVPAQQHHYFTSPFNETLHHQTRYTNHLRPCSSGVFFVVVAYK